MPSPTLVIPTATSTPVSEPFRCVGSVADILPGDSERLHTGCDGAVWLVTDQGIAELDDGTWTVRLTELAGPVAGVDAAGRIWVVGEEYDEISAWDGTAWTAYGAEAGWTPLADMGYRPVGWGQCDPAGRFWLTTSQDVRVFDGEEWTIFTSEEMGMGEFPVESCIPELQMTVLKSTGDVWIGECDWTAAPCGGQGARWFDGQAWHGADSPASHGCVAAMEEDAAGNVWLGVDEVLWRYEPTLENWTRFPPPESPPFGYRRHGGIMGVAADPFGRLWVTELLCGGASCDAHALYQVQDGVWTLLPSEEEWYYVPELSVVTDAAGTTWLFGDIIYRLTETDLQPAAHLLPVSTAMGAAGEVWFIAHDYPHGILCTVDGEGGG